MRVGKYVINTNMLEGARWCEDKRELLLWFPGEDNDMRLSGKDAVQTMAALCNACEHHIGEDVCLMLTPEEEAE